MSPVARWTGYIMQGKGLWSIVKVYKVIIRCLVVLLIDLA